jgi:uncharacterized protein YdcH (DUF465 family)
MITKEKLEHHISHLEEKVEKLKKEVHDAYLDNVSDIEVEKMKKQKLKLKDEVEACKRQLSELSS